MDVFHNSSDTLHIYILILTNVYFNKRALSFIFFLSMLSETLIEMFTVNVLLNICKCSSSDVDKADWQNVHMQHVSRAGTYAVATGMAFDKWE